MGFLIGFQVETELSPILFRVRVASGMRLSEATSVASEDLVLDLCLSRLLMEAQFSEVSDEGSNGGQTLTP